MRNLLIAILCIVSMSAFAEPGKVLIKGCDHKVYIYNSERGTGRRYFESKRQGEWQELQIPEEECCDVLYLIAGKIKTWFRIRPAETVKIVINGTNLDFLGDESDINQYLFDWTQKLYFARPNNLLFNVQNMMTVIPQSQRGMADARKFYTPDYMLWVSSLKKELDKDLKYAKLNDEDFVKEQQKRIEYAWLELQFANFQVASNVIDSIPIESMKFIRKIKLDDSDLLEYPGCDVIQSQYIVMSERLGILKYEHYTDYLRARAELLKNPVVMENYVLHELFIIFKMRNYFYQGDRLLASVEDLIISDEGRKRYNEYRSFYEEAMLSDMEGKKVPNYTFETNKGDSLCFSQFLGKYLFIDVWATWCSPCRSQMPYLKKLEERLKSYPIQFLSLSVDKPQNKLYWKEMLEKFDMQNGNCAITPDAFNHPFMNEFKVTAIPHYVLIDPDGKVIMSSARLPSDPLLELQLKELMRSQVIL